MKRPRSPRLQRARFPIAEPLERRRLLASASQLLSFDFAGTNPWQATPGAQSAGASATLDYGGYGTIDVAGGTANSNALRLSVNATPASGTWSSALASGPLAVANPGVAHLGLLTISFNLSASQARPVKVFVTSYDAGGNRTGGLATTIVPAAANSYQRFAVDLSTMTASGGGTFNPAAPKVSFDFEMSSANGWSSAGAQLRVDNVAYSKPAYYVKAGGSNSRDGKSEANAFATPQKALDVSQPGDVIVLMDGTYNQITLNTGAMHFKKGGTPAAWIAVKNYPGQSPVIYNEAWNAILVGAQTTTVTTTALGYIEVRGLHVQGGSAKVGSRAAPDGVYDPTARNADQYGVYGQYAGISDPRSNGNGISIDGRYETNKPHDIRFADNWVEDCAGAGIGAGDCDRVQIENNLVQDNCYWDIYATSGISVLSGYNFDATSGSVTRLVRNNVSSGNIHKEIWKSYGNYSDGNGIIIDLNKFAAVKDADGNVTTPARAALGRTLVTNNVTYDNGGSGIHTYSADHVDVINNVAYMNSASPYLNYGQIFANASGDVRFYNNIAVAPTSVSSAGKQKPVNGGASSIFQGNVWFGGTQNPVMGTNDTKADPKFVLASVDKLVADFRLQSSSPAVNRGTAALAPHLDADGRPRYAAPDAGAYEFAPAAPTSVALAAQSDTGTPGDGRTRLNNASAANRLTFLVAGTLAGATVTLYADGVAVGSATATGTTTTVTTDGVTALADGSRAVAAVQTFAGSPSAPSPALAVAVETLRPTLAGAPLINAGTPQAASRSQVRTVTWTFSEPVTTAGVAAFALVDRDGGAVVDLSSRAVSVSGNAVTLTLDAYGVDSGAQLFLPDGNYALTLLDATDLAGNPLDAAGGLPRLNFFKLLGDFNGDRRVTGVDYLAWNRAYGQLAGAGAADVAFDLSGDGRVTGVDYLAWNRRYAASLAHRDDDGLSYA